MTADNAFTSENSPLLQSYLPAIDSKTFTDCGSLLSYFAAVRTDFHMPSDSV